MLHFTVFSVYMEINVEHSLVIIVKIRALNKTILHGFWIIDIFTYNSNPDAHIYINAI